MTAVARRAGIDTCALLEPGHCAKLMSVQRWDPLNERQLLLLQRIGAGDDLSGPDGVSHRTSARGLQTRRLVDVSRRDGTWRAQITDTGRFYLDHGHHPDRPDRAVPATGEPHVPTQRQPPSPRGAAGAPTRDRAPKSPATDTIPAQAQQLITRLQEAGSTITVESPDPDTRAWYRRVIHGAKQHHLVPAGFHLRHTGRGRGDLIIRLTDDQAPDDTDWNRIRLNTRRVTADPSLVFAALEQDPTNLDVTPEVLPRCLDLLKALAEQARLCGHRLGVNTKTLHPRLYLQINGARRAVNLHEEYDQVPHVPTDQERRVLRRSPWMSIPTTDKVRSGRLRMEIGRTGWNDQISWADDKRSTLETRLAKIIRDVEARVAADERARQEENRRHQAYLDEQQRREEEQERRWRATIDAARPKAVEALRRKAFRAAYDTWIAATEIRAFCDALEHGDATTDQAERDNRARWIAWGRAKADAIDPTRADTGLAATPFDPEPGPDDLRPYTGEWSPTEPYRDYRTQQTREQVTDALHQADTWHHGMRGRPNWWRHA